MRIRPILFNTEMVRAILREENPKTATRRVAKGIVPFDNDGEYWNTLKNGEWTGPVIKELMIRQKAPYQPGDILYVRETWCNANKEGSEPDFYYYADTFICEDYDKTEWKWRPSIHMPKAAARIWLRVTDVRVERLQDMKTNDFLAEGVMIRPEAFNDPENAYGQAKKMFIAIWNPTIRKEDIKKYGWEANPWVWVIKFERCEKPESEGLE